jgi:hypothetical protein
VNGSYEVLIEIAEAARESLVLGRRGFLSLE